MASVDPTALGRCEVVCHLARGGMGELYLAKKRGLEGFEKLVVLKTMRTTRDRDELAQLLAEARLGATLDHPNIVQVHDVGVQDGRFFIVMEFVHGVDLRRLLRRAGDRGRQIRLEEAISIVLGVCAGLHHAHDKCDSAGRPLRLVHCDISPSNVLVGFDGSVKVADFGIAQARGGREHDGQVAGKIGYMSPEQCLSERLDRRSDLFAVGILLYELTTGENAYPGDDVLTILQSIVAGPPPPPSSRRSDYPPELEAIVLRALARQPAARYPDAQALQLELERFARESMLAVSPVTLMNLTRELFGDELSAWQRARAAGTELADHVAATVTIDVRSADPATRSPRWRRTLVAAAASMLAVGAIAVAGRSASGPDPRAGAERAVAAGGVAPAIAACLARSSANASAGAALPSPASAATDDATSGAAQDAAPTGKPVRTAPRSTRPSPKTPATPTGTPARWNPDAPLPP